MKCEQIRLISGALNGLVIATWWGRGAVPKEKMCVYVCNSTVYKVHFLTLFLYRKRMAPSVHNILITIINYTVYMFKNDDDR